MALWPENWAPVHVFADLLTQWNVGAGGVVGLRYEALPLVLGLHGIEPGRQREVFNAVRILENEAIKRLNPDR